jgi:hypothetical protein
MTKTCRAFFFSLIVPLSLPAQEPAEEAPDGREAPQAYLRGWIYGADESPVAMVLLEEEGGEPVPLAEAAGGAVSASGLYQPLKPGRRAVELRSGEKVLARKDVALRKDEMGTLLAWRTGAKWQAEMFSDTAGTSNSPDRPLRIINFAGGRETLLSIDGGADTKVAADTVQEFRGPRKVSMLRVQVLASDGGPPAQSSVEVDFRSVPSVYVVVGPDYRGRMRPRIILGGQPPEESEEIAEGAADGQR